MIKKENFYLDIYNNFLNKIFNNKISFILCLSIIFFGLLPLTNLSVAGDIELLLKCRLLSLNENIPINLKKDLNCIMKNHFYLIDKCIFLIALVAQKLKSIVLANKLSDYKLLIYYEMFVALFFYIFFLINIILLSKLSDTKITIANIFIVCIFLFTSYLGNFVAFFHQEILIGTFFILKILNFKNNSNKKSKLYINFLIDLIISVFKVYYLLPLFILNFYILNNNFRKFFIYNTLLFFLSLSIFYINNIQELTMHLNETYKLDLNFTLYFKELFYIVFSPAIGIFVTMPLFILLFFSEKNLLFYLKLVSILSLILFLSFFFFWHGSGSSGCRYLYPILILFFEEFRVIISKLIKYKKFKFILILLFISFFQSLNYHSPVLLFGYKDSKFNEDFKILDKERTIGTLPITERFPKSNYKLSPIIFGWSMEINKLLEKEEMEIKINNETRYLNPLEVIPNSNISRLFYISQHNRINYIKDKRLEKLSFKKYLNISSNNYAFILIFIFSIFSYLVIRIKNFKIK